MYITKEQAEERLNKSDLIINVKKDDRGKRGAGLDKITHEIVGTLAHSDKQIDIAEAFNIPQSNVSKLSRGLVNNKLDTDLRDKIQDNVAKKKEDLKDLILGNLSQALVEVSDKVGHLDAKDASRVAKDMSSILQNFDGGGDKRTNVAVIINTVAQKEESYYKVVNS